LKISIFKTSRLLFFGLLTLAIITGSALSASAKQSRIAIVPFTMNAEKDLTFLREGIHSMLSSRLSWENKVFVVARQETAAAVKTIAAPLNEAKARKIGSMLKADYVLFGSLTIFGNSVSMDGTIVDISNAKQPLSFFNQSQGMEEVIPRINLFAEEINEKLFNRKTAVRQLPQQRVPAQTPSQYMHPERLLSGEFVEPDEAGGGRTPFVMTGRRDATPGFWKSKNFRMQIKGLALGDVDGDGKIETVMITNREVHIYRSENDRFIKIKEMKGEKYYKYLSVDVADINKNGKAEIFVTCLNKNRKSLESFVLEFNGSDFKTIADNENWYFRVIPRPVLGPMLVGQKMGVSDLFMPGVYELVWTGSEYKPQGKVAMGLPENVTVFGFTIGDLFNTKGEVVAAFDEEERLRIYSTGGSQEWKSDEKFGGSENYIDIDFQDEEADYESRVYLPHRLYIVDLNKDGKTELITVKNKSISGHLFKSFRHYSGATFESLSWDGLGLAKNWHTRKVSGYICDYAIGDINNDGKLELVAAIVSKRDVLGQKAKSTIITYDLAPLTEK
jgi:TolB-like protein